MKLLKHRSFRFQMLLLACVIFVVMLLVLLMVFFSSNQIITKSRRNDMDLLVQQYENNLFLTAERYYVLLNSLRHSSSVKKFMTASDPSEYVETATQLMNEMRFYKAACPGVIDILLYTDRYSIHTGSRLQSPPTSLAIPSGSRIFYSGVCSDLNADEEDIPIFILGCNVQSYGQGKAIRDIGTVLLAIDGTSFSMDTSESMEGNTEIYCYFLDQQDTIFASNTSDTSNFDKVLAELGGQLVQKELRNADIGKYYVSILHLRHFGISLVITLSKNALLNMTFSTFFQAFIAIFLLSAFIFVVVLHTLQNVLQPMNNMLRVMDEVNLGDITSLSMRAHIEGFHELEVMVERFNVMLDKIQSLNADLFSSMEELYYLEILKRESELGYLRSQINPHFLYNTLETIRGMAVVENAPLVQKMTGALAHVFRYNVKGGDEVSLGEEIDMIRSYLVIQALRFGDRLHVEYQIEETAYNCLLPKMILQPIVENLVLHGIENSVKQDGSIWIAAYTAGDMLAIDCSDNGCGMTSEELHQVYTHLYSKIQATDTGIGFKNVYERLRLLYKHNFRFVISSEKNVGTNVHIEIPYRGIRDETSQNSHC